MTRNEVKFSIVVGTWNRLEQLQACVTSIFEQTRTPVRVYVTDAGSTDGTIEYLKSMESDRLFPIFVGTRLGQARAYNEIFAIIDTPYVCWLSDDNVIVNQGLDIAVDVLEEEPNIGMVGLKVKDVAGPFVKAPYIGGISCIGILNVNQGVLRTAVLKKVGGFSETFRDYGIDPDLTAKVLFSGQQIVYTRMIAVHHQRNWSNDRTSIEYSRQMEKQKIYQELYKQKYSSVVRGSLGWKVKKQLWRFMQYISIQLRSTNSSQTLLGMISRDWHNIFMGRYISLLDPWHCYGKAYYLLQSNPLCQHQNSLPPDPQWSDHLQNSESTLSDSCTSHEK